MFVSLVNQRRQRVDISVIDILKFLYYIFVIYLLFRYSLILSFCSQQAHRVIGVQPRPLCGGSDPYRESPLPHHYPRNHPRRVTPNRTTDVTLHSTVQTITHAPNDGHSGQCVTEVIPSASTTTERTTPLPPYDSAPPSTAASVASMRTLLKMEKTSCTDCLKKLRFWRWNFSEFARDCYAPFLQKTFVKVR